MDSHSAHETTKVSRTTTKGEEEEKENPFACHSENQCSQKTEEIKISSTPSSEAFKTGATSTTEPLGNTFQKTSLM